MGGDLGPRAVFLACEKALSRFPSLELLLVGTSHGQSLLPANLRTHTRCDWLMADAEISPALKPTEVLRQRKSSMWLAVESLALGHSVACVSGGNTGALMVAGKRLLGMLPGVERPAICQRWPTRQGQTWVLDLGANIEASPLLLVQFARMGAVVSGAASPRVALLNIGTEPNKGGELLSGAAKLLGELQSLQYAGFIEPNHMLDGNVDVVVTDGFTGNIALKASEGAAVFLVEQLRAAFSATWYGKLVGQLAKPVLLKWRKKFDPARYNGASFLGLTRPLIKSHGSADSAAFFNAICVAIQQAEQGLPAKLVANLVEHVGAAEAGEPS
ncbi:phosphate acyltransferase PlsX [Simiduia sp. 21SJ11W-1]|uniref:phosphate acyltransferase PlsX n=1 Tax=Simiduia sp. 21SJ11W-1 TaxID=2909669 RepID=UPI0020A1BFEE|nr:phosphate acyltransferase PlsX [Simiduia sp. 21SJ11W-1]UTA49655.1 phosphate acyltransferase PlsX [Simiduia sp. 21SJ11W-1]